MKIWIAAAAALLSVPTPALACSCLATDDPQQLSSLAAETAKGAIALVEAESLTTYHDNSGAGEQMRIVRTIAGTAQGNFRVERGGLPSSASCDLMPDRGQRLVLILYPATTNSGGGPVYRISGLCTDVLLEKPIFRDAVSRSIAGVEAGERG